MRKIAGLRIGSVAVALLAAGCATVGTVPGGANTMSFPHFTAVIATKEDRLETLAASFLKDASQAETIGEFNGITAVREGQVVAIPTTPLRRGGVSPRRYQTVPVLSYHKFSVDRSDKMTVTRDAFERQMGFLKEKGCTVIPLVRLFDYLDGATEIPPRSVVITIDDGWKSTAEIAFPILKRYGYPATLFVYTRLIKGGETTLSWEQVKELAESGMDIQAHTVSHRNLTAPAGEETFAEYFAALEGELAESARTIREKTGRDVRYLAYPYGETNHLVVAVASKLGYRGGLTAVRGGNPFFTGAFRVRRSMIYGDYELAQFERNLLTSDNEVLR